jgi:hypothetical protein
MFSISTELAQRSDTVCVLRIDSNYIKFKYTNAIPQMLLHVSVNECFSAVLAMKLRLVQNVSCYTVKFLWNVDTLAIWTK